MRSKQLVALLISLSFIQVAQANPLTHLFKAGGRALFRKSGSTTTRQGAKQLGKQSVRGGTKSVARTRATQAARYFADDAARASGVVLKSTSYADELARISSSITARNHRRLMMMAPELKKTGQTAQVMRKLSKSSNIDKAVETLWKHRGKLATAAAVGTVMIHGDEIAKSAAEHVARPVVENSIEHIAKPVVAKLTNGLTLAAIAIASFFGLWTIRKRPRLKTLFAVFYKWLPFKRGKKTQVT